MGWSRIYSIDMGAGNLLLAKCSKALSSWIKKSSLFCFFCKFLCLLYLRICFYLTRAKPWLEFSIKSIFNKYNLRSFQRELVGFNNFWISFIFREYNWVSVSKMSNECLSVWEVSFFLLFQRKLYILFSISFLIYFGIVYIWTMYQSLDKTNWSHSVKLSLVLSQLKLSREELTKLTQLFWWKIDHAICPGCYMPQPIGLDFLEGLSFS